MRNIELEVDEGARAGGGGYSSIVVGNNSLRYGSVAVIISSRVSRSLKSTRGFKITISIYLWQM